MSEQVTMQFGPLELRKTEEGWQYLSEGVGHEPDTWCDAKRRAESSNRSKYNQLEPHAVDRRKGRLGRHVDAWRPVLHYSEEQVWELLSRHRVEAPVPYRLGWGRFSCMTCI